MLHSLTKGRRGEGGEAPIHTPVIATQAAAPKLAQGNPQDEIFIEKKPSGCWRLESLPGTRGSEQPERNSARRGFSLHTVEMHATVTGQALRYCVLFPLVF